MGLDADPAAAAPINLRDITIAGHGVRISVTPVNATVTVFELVDRISAVYLGHIASADTAQPRLRLAPDGPDWARDPRHRETIMAAALSFWRQERAVYIKGLGTLGLPILSAPSIDGRTVRLCRQPSQPSIRVTFAEVEPHYVGTVADLDQGHARFIPAPDHLDWVRFGSRIRRIVDESILAFAHQGTGGGRPAG